MEILRSRGAKRQPSAPAQLQKGALETPRSARLWASPQVLVASPFSLKALRQAPDQHAAAAGPTLVEFQGLKPIVVRLTPPATSAHHSQW